MKEKDFKELLKYASCYDYVIYVTKEGVQSVMSCRCCGGGPINGSTGKNGVNVFHAVGCIVDAWEKWDKKGR